MSSPVIATVGHGFSALWYLTRATGLVALMVLTATVVLGIISSIGWTTERWPRFLSQAVHRNLSLFCLVLVAVHVVTTVADGYVPIGLLDAVVPFRSPYRPLWVGLGALAFDVLLAVAITSGLRRYIGLRAWRGVHWLAYLCWPVAMLHGLGSGSDTRLSLALILYVLCGAAVAGALAWRLAVSRARSVAWRGGAGLAAVGVFVGTAVFALVGPLRPGWSQRSGTSSALLAQLSAGTQSTAGRSGSSSSSPASSATTVPSAPFDSAVRGSIQTSSLANTGHEEVLLSLQLQDDNAPLTVKLIGDPTSHGVAMTASDVTFGPARGTVTSLEGTTVGASVTGPAGTLHLTMQLDINQSSGVVTGTVSGT